MMMKRSHFLSTMCRHSVTLYHFCQFLTNLVNKQLRTSVFSSIKWERGYHLSYRCSENQVRPYETLRLVQCRQWAQNKVPPLIGLPYQCLILWVRYYSHFKMRKLSFGEILIYQNCRIWKLNLTSEAMFFLLSQAVCKRVDELISSFSFQATFTRNHF